MNHIALLMENQPGALSRVIGLFSQRGYNIDSLSVAPTQDETLSRLTMTIGEEGADINQILKQLYKLVDVVMVQNLSEADSLTLELASSKVKESASLKFCTITTSTNLYNCFKIWLISAPSSPMVIVNLDSVSSCVGATDKESMLYPL